MYRTIRQLQCYILLLRCDLFTHRLGVLFLFLRIDYIHRRLRFSLKLVVVRIAVRQRCKNFRTLHHFSGILIQIRQTTALFLVVRLIVQPDLQRFYLYKISIQCTTRSHHQLQHFRIVQVLRQLILAHHQSTQRTARHLFLDLRQILFTGTGRRKFRKKTRLLHHFQFTQLLTRHYQRRYTTHNIRQQRYRIITVLRIISTIQRPVVHIADIYMYIT